MRAAIKGLTRRFAWILGGLLLAAHLPAHAAVEYIHTDSLGSPVAITDSDGNVIQTSEYEPYGKLLNRPLTDAPGYTGHETDATTGMVYAQQRYYDPQIGQFLSSDPVVPDPATAWNFNRYNYAANNPYKFKDPDGRIIDTIADIAFIAYDAYTIATDGATATNVGALGADLVAAAIPGVTGAGLAVRAAEHSVEAVRVADKGVEAGEKTYQTYTKAPLNPETHGTYSGRTSGRGTPAQNVARRDSGHHMNRTHGPAVLDKSSSNAAAIRGREQQLIDAHGGAQSMGGTSGNKINSISPSNQKSQVYEAARKEEFGE